jgi:EAL domain-containing protein (putative c-di-GMP-specific phosphodiesterase class I)
MKYELTIEPMGDYLHVRGSGKLNYDVALDAWKRIVKACEEYQCYNVLGEQYMDNALTTMEAWDHQKIFAEAGVTHNMRIAWVDLNPATVEKTQFVETVLINRGLVNGQLFADVETAKQWLLSGEEA